MDIRRYFGSPDIRRLKVRGDTVALARALRHRKTEVRRGAAKALGELGTVDAEQQLAMLLDDADESVRGAALGALADIATKGTLIEIAWRIGSGKLSALEALAIAILRKHEATVLPAIEKQFHFVWKSHPNLRVKGRSEPRNLIATLVRIDTERAFASIANLANLESGRGGQHVRKTLDECKRDAFPAMEWIIRHDHRDDVVRYALARVSEIGDAGALDLLLTAYKKEGAEMQRDAAAVALTTLVRNERTALSVPQLQELSNLVALPAISLEWFSSHYNADVSTVVALAREELSRRGGTERGEHE
jgi:HEAT repeat protein